MKITIDSYPSDDTGYGDCSYKPSFPHVSLKLAALATYVHPTGLPCGALVKNPPANTGEARDTSLIPRFGQFPGEGNGDPFQYSCLGSSIDRGA